MNNKVNMAELKKVVDGMITDYRTKPTYNQAAASLVADGVKDKIDARNGYQTVLSRPITPVKSPGVL
jgi:hypothetical protein